MLSSDPAQPGHRYQKLLHTLQQLLELDAVALKTTLEEAAQVVLSALSADKVDIFLYQPSQNALVALGVSDTPMGVRQRQLGLDRLPLANGGRTVEVFQTGHSYITGHADQDPIELKGVIDGLGVRSQIVCVFHVEGERRGVLQMYSADRNRFTNEDLQFLEAVSRWVGMVTHRAELVERLEREAGERGRREATDELLSLLTPRQQEIAALIAAGLTNAQIADRLTITAGSVANHVQRILSRLGAARRAQIAAWIAEHQRTTGER